MIQTMTVEHNKTVLIDYTLTDENGSIIDTTKEQQPLSYVHGAGQLIPGLEKALEGKTAGNQIEVAIVPADAYGEYNQELFQEVPRSEFKGIDKIDVGMQFQTHNPQGHSQIVTVSKVTDEMVTIDSNHPLAGKTLHFDVTVVDVQETQAHGCGCGPSHESSNQPYDDYTGHNGGGCGSGGCGC